MTMRSISEWQRVLKAAASRKFPDSTWGEAERVQSVQEQLDDVKAALEIERGARHSDDHAHRDPDHRIAALIADILILAEEREANVESELEKVLAWFEERN